MTLTILLVVFVLLMVYDVYIYFAKGTEATISLVLYDFCQRNPLVPFVLGVIVGHILWPHSY